MEMKWINFLMMDFENFSSYYFFACLKGDAMANVGAWMLSRDQYRILRLTSFGDT